MKPILPRAFRKLPISIKRRILAELFDFPLNNERDEMLELADVMVESAVGYVQIPMGLATGFLIDGEYLDVPMATEESSVIAAASYAATIAARGGGITTWADSPIMAGQVFLERVAHSGAKALTANLARIRQELNLICASIRARGGGVHDLRSYHLPHSGIFCFEFDVDVRDAMGATMLNRSAERISPLLEQITGGRKLMAILSNAAERRRAGATFGIPLSLIRKRNLKSAEIARRIVLAGRVAQEDPRRAVTHNKGILNGMTAVALATGNDTRGLEAAVHAYAVRKGHYRGLTDYRIEDDRLIGELQTPAPFGAKGGAIGLHPMCAAAMRILAIDSAQRLSRIAVAVGLAQNFAALLALVTEGIQHGHMRLHAMRLAWRAGARGKEVAKIAQTLAREGRIGLDHARALLQTLRDSAGRLSS